LAAVFPDVGDIVPHSGPALLIDRVTHHDENETVCVAHIESTNQYVRDGVADAALALELMAQTVAAHVGLQNRWSGAKPRAGYVVGVPKMKFYGGDYLREDVITIRVRLSYHEGPVGRFDGVVMVGDMKRAEGTLTVFEPPLAVAPGQGEEHVDGAGG
jgi:predicted hotdog family 3-hydroxylacyl-ACP dehydratase